MRLCAARPISHVPVHGYRSLGGRPLTLFEEGAPPMSERIHDFLRRRREDGLDDGPCLVVDLEIVRENYGAFAKALLDSRIFYAVKANPAPELLALLASLGSCF